MDHKEIVDRKWCQKHHDLWTCHIDAISTHNISALTVQVLHSPPWRRVRDKDIRYIFRLGLQLYIKALLASKALQI